MDSPSPSTSAYFEEGDDEGPTQEPLPPCPPILNDYPDLQHAWKVVNWVYTTRKEKSGSKKARKTVVKQTAGFLMLGLYILWDTATTKSESEPSLQASGPSGLDTLHSERKQWAHVACQVHRRQDWILQHEPATIAATKNYDSPAMLSMTHSSCQHAMIMLKKDDEASGFLPTKWKVKHLQEFVDWWKLLDIGRVALQALQDDTHTKIVKAKECSNAIRKLHKRIELAKQGIS